MRKYAALLVIVLLLGLVPAVLAGGWAVITLDEPPGEIHAGQPWNLSFTVLQHGRTPVHRLDASTPVEPLLVAENPATGQRVEIVAAPTKKAGQFVAEVIFPSEGAWAWTIFPNPLAGETLFEPLTVLPAISAAPPAEIQPAAPVVQPVDTGRQAAQSTALSTGNSGAVSAGLRWAAFIVVVIAAVLFAIESRRRAAPAGVES